MKPRGRPAGSGRKPRPVCSEGCGAPVCGRTQSGRCRQCAARLGGADLKARRMAGLQTEQAKIRRGRAVSEHRMAWCPPELRDEARRLARIKRMKQAEVRAVILAQHESDMARFRARITAPAAPLNQGNG